jgi:hypothetical protein
VGATGTCVGILWVKEYVRFGELRAVAIIWLVAAAAADITITAILSYHLRSRRAGFQNTNKLLDNIVRLTIQNGLLTTLTALTDLTMYLSTYVRPRSMIFHSSANLRRIVKSRITSRSRSSFPSSTATLFCPRLIPAKLAARRSGRLALSTCPTS